MIDHRHMPEPRLDPPDESPLTWCRHCGFDPMCDCEPEDENDMDPPDDWCEEDEDDTPYREPYRTDGEDEPLPEDE